MIFWKQFLVTISFVYVFISLCSIVHCERHDVQEMMYRTFEGAPHCFRRLNGTHQFGCSSPRDGSYGVIHFIKNESDLMDFLANAVAGPYAVILTPVLFRRDVIDSLIASSKVSGIVLNTALAPDIDPLPSSFSPDDVCPNKYSGVHNSCTIAWNPAANNFLHHDWPLPVFLINKLDHYSAIADCYDKFNLPLDESQLARPLCSLHMNSHMYAAVNSETCLRRINYYGVNTAMYCDPLGDENVVLPSLPWIESGTKNVIVVGARMDALSIFDGIAPGAMSAATGLVTFITTAYVFHKMTSSSDNQINNDIGVLFVLFTGEAQDYIGSSRVVYDMQHGLFPSRNKKLSLKNIRLFIEISQLSSSKKVFVHHTSDKEVIDFIDHLNGSLYDIDFEKSKVQELPPASFQSFYKVDTTVGGAILSNFDKKFVNTYYNSLYDTAKYLGYEYANGSIIDKSPTYDLQNRLAGVAHVLSSFLYTKSTTKEPPSINLQKTAGLVDELLHCYLETKKCRLLKEVGPVVSDKLPDLLPLYVGVKNNPENHFARVSGFILAYLTGKRLSIPKNDCVNDETQKDYSYFWMNGESDQGICINSSVLFTPAESPAFIIPGYDLKSGQYSTWTESLWGACSLVMFIKPYRFQEVVVLCSGLAVLILSFTTVFWINKRADFLFLSVTPTSC